MEDYGYNTVEEALRELRSGKIIVVLDSADRENEGDLICAARHADTANVNFMASFGKGLICMPMSRSLAEKLDLPPMVARNSDNHCTAFTVSIDHASTTTGISAAERSVTARKCVEASARPEDFRRPGHMFPLTAVPGGVLERPGHTEATVDLMRLAGLEECGLCCEIMREDGTMMRTAELLRFAAEHRLKIITVADIVRYRKCHEQWLEKVTEADLPTKYGHFRICGFVSRLTGEHHVALVKGDVTGDAPVLCRMHSECMTGDVFGSMRCDCGEQLAEALRRIEKAGRGVLIYLRQEGRGIGLINKLRAYELQEKGMDTVEANIALGFKPDLRHYDAGAAILTGLGVRKIILMTNNPLKMDGLEDYGIEVVGRDPIEMSCNERNEAYLYTKYRKMGHLLHFGSAAGSTGKENE